MRMPQDFTLEEKLMAALPEWNYKIAKPLKQFLNGEVNLEMYYCIQTLRWIGGTATMTELAHITRMPKQQMTKMVNRLVEQELVERIYDPADRRLIKIRITDNASNYIDRFFKEDAGCFHPLIDLLSEKDIAAFNEALRLLLEILLKIPCDWSLSAETTKVESPSSL